VDTPDAESRKALAVTRKRPETGGDPVVGWALQHAVQAWAAFVFLAFVLKVILETRGNREIALGVLQAADPGSVLLGLVASFLPYLLFTGALALAMLAASSESALVTRALAIVASLASLLITPAWIALVLLLLLGVVLTARWLQQRSSLRTGKCATWRRDWRDILLASQLVAVALYLVAPGMWLPPERIALTSGVTEVGYVLNVDSEWTSALREGDRVLLRLPTDTVMAREVCRLRPWPSPTIPQLIFGGGPAAIGDC
jgi:hypothetical protein